MSGEETAFLRDVQGFIDFAIRNGLTFPMVMASLVQDMNQIAREGFDYDKARKQGFAPKVEGYASLTAEEFGDSEDQESSTTE